MTPLAPEIVLLREAFRELLHDVSHQTIWILHRPRGSSPTDNARPTATNVLRHRANSGRASPAVRESVDGAELWRPPNDPRAGYSCSMAVSPGNGEGQTGAKREAQPGAEREAQLGEERDARRAERSERRDAVAERPGVMIPSRRKRLPLEAPLMRVVATAGIVGIGVLIAAIMGSQHSQGWVIGLVVSLVSVALAAVLWSSRRL